MTEGRVTRGQEHVPWHTKVPRNKCTRGLMIRGDSNDPNDHCGAEQMCRDGSREVGPGLNGRTKAAGKVCAPAVNDAIHACYGHSRALEARY